MGFSPKNDLTFYAGPMMQTFLYVSEPSVAPKPSLPGERVFNTIYCLVLVFMTLLPPPFEDFPADTLDATR